MHDPEVVIVGAGIAGSALATILARQGVSVLLLEKTLLHVDRIRGEWLAPWGVAQATKIGILDDLITAGGHYITWSMRYSENVPIEEGRAKAFDLSSLFPNVPGAMGVGHPQLCETLNTAARDAGATILRGVSRIEVQPGARPKIAFDHEGQHSELRPKLVVGADGRGSAVARQIGLRVESDPLHHFMSGLLVDGAHGWPEDSQSVGVEDDRTFFIFPQGDGRIRLYLCYAPSQRRRFAGPDATAAFLKAFTLRCLPEESNLASARPAGPCLSYPNADTWIDVPVAPGVVLIGDAAGHNDPTIGQGLSIAFSDVLMVTKVLLEQSSWDVGAFAPYLEDRRERMRRLRFLGRLVSAFRCDYSDAARRRQDEVRRQLPTRPTLGYQALGQVKGPYDTPADAFSQKAWDDIMEIEAG